MGAAGKRAGILLAAALTASAGAFFLSRPAPGPVVLNLIPAATASVVATPADGGTAPPPSASPSAPPPLPPGPPGRFADAVDVSSFQRGNIHTHTVWSDGDSPPPDVYRWYRDHGYNFLAVTDHNSRTNPALFRLLERPGFVILGGEEITMTSEGHPVHVNSLCNRSTIGGGRFHSPGAALRWAIPQITAQGGVALINHPNFDWALTAADVLLGKGARLLEIASAHPYVHNDGDATRPGVEAIWDTVLTAGGDFAGVAVDDSHHFKPSAAEPAARPGRAWVNVFAAKADRKAICAALAAGQLYASTGPSLTRIAVKDDTYAVWPASPDAEVEFVAQNGLVVAKVHAGSDGRAAYTLRGGEAYVRARIATPDGKHAWTQPSRVLSKE